MATESFGIIEADQEPVNKISLPVQLLQRPPRSPSSKARIIIKNRRKRYLDTHPEYFSSQSLELAGLPCTRL